MEKQLIESILKPTGITTKPSDLQFKDFLRRIKTLKKEEINFLLRSKLMEFEEAGDQKAIQVIRLK